MKKLLLSLTAAVLITAQAFAQTDVEGCKDSPMFPARMTNYFISECKNNYDAVDFSTAPGGEKIISKEGTRTSIQYNFNSESGAQKPSSLQILRNYENAAKKIGATTVFFGASEDKATFKLMKGGKETAWIKVECGGNDGSDFYVLEIVELVEMKQEVTANDILTALNTDGHIALYINFETGKSDIKPESEKIIDEISEMLKANPTLKISVEGHTDNVGTPASNKKLSESRAKSVQTALISKGANEKLITSKGWGQEKPISENTTEDGKAKNRRVEIVKK